MLRSFLVVVILFVSAVQDTKAQEYLGGPLEIGTGSGRPGEVVVVSVYGSFSAPLVFLSVPLQFDAERLAFLSYSLEGTIAAGARMGIEYNNFEPGDAIFGLGDNGQSIRDRVHFPPGERQFLGSLRFQVLATAEAGSAFVTPVAHVGTGGGLVFSLYDVDSGNAPSVHPTPILEGAVTVLPPLGPRPVKDFQCSQLLTRAVLSFSPTEPYDRIEVSRDGQAIATLPGSATGATDPLPGQGEFSYSVVAWKGNAGSIPVTCVVKSRPPAAPPVMEFNCDDGQLSWTSPVNYDRLTVFRDGQEIASLPGGAQTYADPDAGSSLALYSIVGELEGFRSPEVNCLAHGLWILEVGDVQAPLGATRVTVPIYATNARAIVGFGFCLEIDPLRFKFRTNAALGMAGTVGFPEPEVTAMGPLGACGHPAAGIYYDFNAPRNPEKYLQVGVRQHVFNFVFEPLGSFSDGDTFDTALIPSTIDISGGTTFTLPEGRSQAADIFIPGQIRFGSGGPQAVKRLNARIEDGAGGGAAGAGLDAALSWENGSSYEKIRIERNGVSLGEIPGGQVGFVDRAVPSGIFTYKVVGLSGGKSSFPTSALLSTLSPRGTFLRGDANRDSRVNLADPLATLRFLFLSDALPCEDAADADDSGLLDLTDVIFTIRYLFQAGQGIKAPGTAYPWFDPTPDGLGCRG